MRPLQSSGFRRQAPRETQRFGNDGAKLADYMARLMLKQIADVGLLLLGAITRLALRVGI